MGSLNRNETKVLLNGRWLSEQELEDVKYIVQTFSQLSRYELARRTGKQYAVETKVLSLAARQVSVDWRKRYGFEPVLLETFVDVKLYIDTKKLRRLIESPGQLKLVYEENWKTKRSAA